MEVSHEKVLKKVDTTKNTVDILNDGKVISSIYEPIFKSLKDKEYILEKVQKAISNIKNKTFEINSILYPLKMTGGSRLDLSNNKKLEILNNILNNLHECSTAVDEISEELYNYFELNNINNTNLNDLKGFIKSLMKNYVHYLNRIYSGREFPTKLSKINKNLSNNLNRLKTEDNNLRSKYTSFMEEESDKQKEFQESIETFKNKLKNFIEDIENTIEEIHTEIEDNKNSKDKNEPSNPVQNKNSTEVLSQNRVKTKVNNSLIESILDDYEKKIQKAKNLDEKLKIDSYFIDKIDSYGLNLIEIFKINMNDKFSFIFFILLIHIIATSLIEFFIMNDYVTNLVYVIAIYIGIYIFLMSLAVVILNKFTGYKAKILLNYLNTDFNMDLIIIHLFMPF